MKAFLWCKNIGNHPFFQSLFRFSTIGDCLSVPFRPLHVSGPNASVLLSGTYWRLLCNACSSTFFVLWLPRKQRRRLRLKAKVRTASQSTGRICREEETHLCWSLQLLLPLTSRTVTLWVFLSTATAPHPVFFILPPLFILVPKSYVLIHKTSLERLLTILTGHFLTRCLRLGQRGPGIWRGVITGEMQPYVRLWFVAEWNLKKPWVAMRCSGMAPSGYGLHKSDTAEHYGPADGEAKTPRRRQSHRSHKVCTYAAT